MGDGVLAYFGYPRADEHDAESAVRAGLSLVEAVAGLETAAGEPVQVRIRIATALLVVGDLIGQGAAQEQAVVGETPNLGARFQALAAPGAVVIAPSTQRLTGGLFEYEERRARGCVHRSWSRACCGRARPRTASRHCAQSARRSSAVTRSWRCCTAAGSTPKEAMALSCWSPASQASASRVSPRPSSSDLRLYCSPDHRESALYPSITRLERAAGFRREDAAEHRLDKLEALLAQATANPDEAAPLLAALLWLPTGERCPPLSLTPQGQEEKTLRGLVAQVEGLAARTPVLMLFEDAQ
jgi:Adenylate and Guanylate cyclase catalytic domain